MTLGEKIKAIRKEKKITQSALCDGIVTRNMLSQIECGKASPSLDTLKALATRLDTSLAYLISDEATPFYYEKMRRIGRIKELYSQRRYDECIKEISTLSERDDEINLILTVCYFNIGKRYVLYGSLNKGQNALELAKEYANKTVYDTSAIGNLILLYLSLCKNIKSPLLELDTKAVERNIETLFEYELYKYIIKDYSYPFKNENLKNHILAKEKMNNRDYKGALQLLIKIEENKKDYNAYVFFSVYSDIEACYKQLLDFENAYRYSNKRVSLMEGFRQ